MTSFKILLPVCAIAAILVAGCSKSGSADDPHSSTFSDSIPPVVELKSPTNNQVFVSGDVIKVDGRVTDDNSIYQGSVRITDDANNAILKDQIYEIHGAQSYDFHVEYETSVTVTANYTVTAQFEDHGFSFDTKIAKIKVNP